MTLGDRLCGTLERMLEWRVAAGYASESHRCLLRPFVEYVGTAWPDEPLVTREMVDAWLAERGYEANTQAVFVSCLRGLCSFSNFEGVADYVPDSDYAVAHVAYQPYLFTEDELGALFLAVDSYEALSHNGRKLLPGLVLPVWTRMLYCCGMRPSEPPSLLHKDVDLGTGDVYIRQSKRHKDRHIVLSDGMRGLCERYDALSARDRTWFFERWDGGPYSASWYHGVWRRVLERSGVEWRGRPRPYDLRHQFASASIARWTDEGRDAMALLPALSAYMGHSKIESTTYYVHMLPERLRASARVDWDGLREVYGGDAQ